MASNLGFSDYTVARMNEISYEQKILQSTWNCVKVLEGLVQSRKFLHTNIATGQYGLATHF